MKNYLAIFEVWDIIEKGYVPTYNALTNQLTIESKLEKRENDYAINLLVRLLNR